MEQKKNPKVDLNRKTGLFFNIGLIVSLVLVITAFEWKFYDDLETIDLGNLVEEETEILDIPITEMPPPPPPVLQQPEIIEVPEDEEIEEQVTMELDVEVQEEKPVQAPTKINAPPPPAPVVEESDEIFLVVEESAEPQGGFEEFYKYVAKNIQYPKQARRMGVEGRVIIQVVIDKDGTLTDMKVLKGIGSGCDEEAVRVLKGSPKWKPGKQRGRAVRQKMTVPIQFKLS
ncbi:MAG: TonB family protein [Microscillaceae bacterium]|nr:TonB family protein [Microscillaceae bacterium]